MVTAQPAAPGVLGVKVALSTSAHKPLQPRLPCPSAVSLLAPLTHTLSLLGVEHKAFPEAACAPRGQMLEIQRAQAVLGS